MVVACKVVFGFVLLNGGVMFQGTFSGALFSGALLRQSLILK